jgi:hypothetical protein
MRGMERLVISKNRKETADKSKKNTRMRQQRCYRTGCIGASRGSRTKWTRRSIHTGKDFSSNPKGARVPSIFGQRSNSRRSDRRAGRSCSCVHKAFFGDSKNGGIFKAWPTDNVKNIGDLFATLQVVVVGVKLSSSLRKFKRGENSGNVPWTSAVLVLAMRFVIWPV